MTPPSAHSAPSAAGAAAPERPGLGETYGPLVLLPRMAALSVVAAALVFTSNNYLIFWRGWPGLNIFSADRGWFGLAPLQTSLDGSAVTLGWIQLALYLAPVAAIVGFVVRTRGRTLHADSEVLSALAAYIVRVAFWGVLLIGLADMVISFLRVEGLLEEVFGHELAQDLGRSKYRGENVHYPLLGVAAVIALFTRSLGFTWLALLIVFAELQIVLARFVFSYEQAFMSDLVRFWYGGLFLFASAYTLLEEGHVRVDILYTGFSERGKAWSNAIGSALLGIPLCWVILTRGMWGRTNVINGPLLNFEVTQQGFGMYVKYLLAGFLLVYALSMLVQFASSFLNNVAILLHEPGSEPAPHDEHAEI